MIFPETWLLLHPDTPTENDNADGHQNPEKGNDDPETIEYRPQDFENKPLSPQMPEDQQTSDEDGIELKYPEGITFELGDELEIVEEVEEESSPKNQLVIQSEDEVDLAGFEEDSQPSEGELFAEVGPEPETQSFEQIRPNQEQKAAPKPSTGLELEQAYHEAQAEKESAHEHGGLFGSHKKKLDPPPFFGPPLPKIASSSSPFWVRLIWHAMPLILFIVGYGSVVLTQGDEVGYAWDEAYYYEPGVQAAEWLGKLMAGLEVFNSEAIYRHWGMIPEHPSMLKWLTGIGLIVFDQPGNELWAIRWPIAIVFGLTLALIYVLGRRYSGPIPGLIAALVYLTMPRVFGHAHFASYETPLIFMTLLMVYCFLKGLDSAWWALITGIATGLLLATKINGLFLPVPLVVWAHIYARRRYVSNLFSMITVGPIVMVLAWPWLWTDTINHFLQYLSFHVNHQVTAVFYQGQLYGANPAAVDLHAPISYPLIMTLITLPIPTLVLILAGLVHAFIKPHRRPLTVLYFMMAAISFAVACGPSTPRYDGVRLFLPAFPFLALLAGAGAYSLMNMLALPFYKLKKSNLPLYNKRLRVIGYSIALLVIATGLYNGVRFHPFYLSYFNEITGGLEGAQDQGYEVTYWGEAINNKVLNELNRMPAGSSIKPLAYHSLCLDHYQQWGLLDPSYKLGGEPPYDCHLLIIRRGFFNRVEPMLADQRRLGNMQIPPQNVKTFMHGNVRMAEIYWTGPGPSPWSTDSESK